MVKITEVQLGSRAARHGIMAGDILLAINGNDVLAKGLRGKQVGEALQRTLNAVMDGEVPNEKNELLIFVDRILEEYMEDYRKISE